MNYRLSRLTSGFIRVQSFQAQSSNDIPIPHRPEACTAISKLSKVAGGGYGVDGHLGSDPEKLDGVADDVPPTTGDLRDLILRCPDTRDINELREMAHPDRRPQSCGLFVQTYLQEYGRLSPVFLVPSAKHRRPAPRWWRSPLSMPAVRLS